VTSIGDYAFEGCSGFTSLTIPDSVTSIGDSAFINCTDLLQISFGNGLTTIHEKAFHSHAFYDTDGTTSLAANVENLKGFIYAGTSVTKMIRLAATGALPTEAGNWYLTADVILTSTWAVPSGTVNLCLNGHSITMKQIADYVPVIRVGNESALNLYDCSNPSTGKITHYSETTDNNTETWIGGGLEVEGTFNMYGGNISGNTTGTGGGVYTYTNGTFNMYGGTISENTATEVTEGGGGGGVYNHGTFNMYGGTISNNTATNGGGVFNTIDGTFNMSGGTISNNTATNGGGVCNYKTFNMSGGTIFNNTATNGGGVYNSGTFNMYGGTVSGNSTTTDGGGVYNSGTFSIKGSPVISDNSKTGDPSTPSNVYLPDNMKIVIEGVLTGDAIIGISMQTAGVFTYRYSNYNNTSPSDFFKPDNNSYNVSWDSIVTEAELTGGAQTKFKVTFNSNGGEGTMDPQVFTKGVAQNLSVNTFTKSGSDFIKWTTNADGTGTSYADGESVTLTDSDLTLYAQWGSSWGCGGGLTATLIDHTLTIEKTDKDGNGKMDDYSYDSGNSNPKPPWHDERSSVTKIVVNDGVKKIGSFAFYECIKLVDLQLTDSIEEIGDHAIYGCLELTAINVPKNLDRVGAGSFANCAKLTNITVSEGNEVFNTDVDGVLYYDDGTIYEVIQYPLGKSDEKYRIIFGVNRIGPYAFENSTLKEVVIPASVLYFGYKGFYTEREGCLDFITFEGGGLQAKEVGTDAFKKMDFINGDHQVDFYDGNHREFRGNTYKCYDNAYRQTGTVTFDAKGHGIAPPTIWPFVLGYKIPEPEKPTAPGFIFEGWFKESDCTNEWHFNIDIPLKTQTTLYAKWDVVKHKVTYDVDGGSADAPVQEDVEENHKFTVAGYSGTKPGYVFDGWTCGGQTYQPGDQATMGTSDMVFKAKWIVPIKYTVTISAGEGGTVSKGSVTVDSGTMITSANNMLRVGSDTVVATPNDGCEFKFWSGVTYSTVTSDMNVTAIFSKEGGMSWTISYSLEKGSWKEGYTAPAQYIEGVGMFLPSSSDIVPYKKDGYTVSFLGWYLTGDKSKTIVSSVTPTDSGDKSFTALWEETVNSYAYTVKYQDAAGRNVAPSYEGTAKFGTKVTPEIISVPGYVPPKETKTITISSNVSKNTVTYVYTVITFTITVSSGDHGTITGPSTVEYGSDAIFAIIGDDDYIVSDVTVDGESVGKKGVYTFASVTSDHSISAAFEYKKDAETVIDDVGNVIEMYTEEQDGKGVRVAIHYNANGKTESYASVSVSEDINSVVSVITDTHGKTVVDTTAMISSDTGATITLSDLNNVKEAAASAAKSLDVDANDRMNIVVDSTTEAGSSKGASISFEGVSSDNTLAITVIGDAGSISFDSKVIADVLKTASAFNVVFEEADDSSITPEQRRAAGDNTVYDIFAVVNGKTMTTFDGEVKISMPYELKEEEEPTDVKIYYVSDEGNVELIGGNWSNGYVTAKLSHFSDYFAAADYVLRNVTLEKTGEGSVEASTYSCSPGTTVKLTATPSDGWKFVKWESQQVTVNDGSFVMPDEDVTVKAVFEKASESSPGFDWWWILIIVAVIACIVGGFWFYNSRKA